VGFGQAQMPPPAGYNSGQLIYDDQFLTTSLDTTKWCPMMGAGGSVYNNSGGTFGGTLPSPYTGPNLKGSAGTFNGVTCNLWHPEYLQVNDGLTIVCEPNGLWGNGTTAGYYQYASGSITSARMPSVMNSVSTASFVLPEAGWYVQGNLKLSTNIQNGINSTLWFLPASGGANNEMDFVQPTLSKQVGATTTTCVNYPLGTAYQDNAGTYTNQTFPNLSPTDFTATFNVFGFEWVPGSHISGYVNGVQRWHILSSAISGGITAQPYIIICHVEMWDSSASGYAWTGCEQGSGPGTGGYGSYAGALDVAEIQAYSYSPVTSVSSSFAIGWAMTNTVNATPQGLTSAFALNGAMASTIGGSTVNIMAAFNLSGAMEVASNEVSLTTAFTFGGSMTLTLREPGTAGTCDIGLESPQIRIQLS